MIQQHYYTRNLKGLYSNTPGYDTIAKSDGLSDGFVKGVLHPLCIYNPPIELTYSNNGNLDIFPQALTCINSPEGNMILGRIIYTGVDSIGFRNTFFAHNLVIDEREKEYLIKDLTKLLYVDSFVKKYNISDGTVLPTISELSFNKNISEFNNLDILFSRLKIDSTFYKKILAALFMSVLNNKCIYISLNASASEFTACAKALIEKLLEGLPFQFRKKVGFVTYSREPRKLQNVNIMFVEKGGISLNNSDQTNSYIFDLSKEGYTNVNIDVEKHYYLQYVWANLKNKDKLIDFHQLAYNMLKNQNDNLKYTLDIYNQLAVLCDFKEGEQNYYSENKGECFKGVYELLSLSNINQKEWISDIFNMMFKGEIRSVENIPSYISHITFIDTLLNFYNSASSNEKERIFEIISISIINSNEVGTYEYSMKVLDKLREKEFIFMDFINIIYESKMLRKNIVLWYVEERFKRMDAINDIFQEMNFWAKVSYSVVAHNTFHDVVKSRLIKIIDMQQDKLAETNKTFNFLKLFCEGKPEIVKENIMSIVEELNSKMFFILDIKDISEEALMNLSIDENEPNNDKVEAIKLLKEIVFSAKDTFAFRTVRKKILEVNNSHRDQVRKAILSLCLRDLHFKHFDRIILGFDIEVKDETIIDFDKLFAYVNKAGGENTLIELFKWISNNVYFSQNDQENFKKAIRNYLASEELPTLNSKNIREELYKTLKGYLIKEVADEVGSSKKVFNGLKSKVSNMLGKS